MKNIIHVVSGSVNEFESYIEQFFLGETVVAAVKAGAVFLWLKTLNLVFGSIKPQMATLDFIQALIETAIKAVTFGYLIFRFGNEMFKWRNRKNKKEES